MRLHIRIEEIQQIRVLNFDINLNQNGVIGIVGKNGTGKTTLIKSIQNLCTADVFNRTSAPTIFRPESRITYNLTGMDPWVFAYDPNLRILNSRSVVPREIKQMISVELPAPHGRRFDHFNRLYSADGQIRTGIVSGSYTRPADLIAFLNGIYDTRKFDNLIDVSIRGFSYYCLLLPDSRYIREDYLSSGEYFLVSLYRQIQAGQKLIVIDEIDISLDAVAQSKIVERLRGFCQQFEVTLIFTTHSMAMMKTLEDDELLYMEETDQGVVASAQSYNSVKSMLFGFKGWDRYILTEDECLQGFLEYLIRRLGIAAHYLYKIIYIGGASNTTDLMRRNNDEGFLSSAENVIAVLDGDQRHLRHARRQQVHCIPIESVEKQLATAYLAAPNSLPNLPEEILIRFNTAGEADKGKILWKHYCQPSEMSVSGLYKYVFESEEASLTTFAQDVLAIFLQRPENVPQ